MTDDVHHYDGLRYWGPVSEARMERICDLIPLAPGARVLDLGCGRGELLLRLAERYGAHGVGVDRSRAALELLRRDAAKRLADGAGSVRTVEAEATDFEAAPPYDLVASLGGPMLGDSLGSTLHALAEWVRPGGFLLWSQPFWASEPPPQYLETTGIGPRDLTTHWDHLALGRSHHLRLLYCCVSNRDEWDHFEGMILYNVERRAAANPEAHDPEGRVEQRRHFHEAQQRWGHEVMGFGLYLFQR